MNVYTDFAWKVFLWGVLIAFVVVLGSILIKN